VKDSGTDGATDGHWALERCEAQEGTDVKGADRTRPTNGHRHGATAARPARDAAFGMDYVHRIRFTSDAFDPANTVLRDVLSAGADSSGRAVVLIDDGVAAAWPDLAKQVRAYADAHADVLTLVADACIVPGGERSKNDWSVFETVARLVNDAGICRHSYVLAIGGGAMLDAVGFAASAAHRGVRLIRFPTTTLAQDDAGIGVKNAINAFGKKNFLGTFHLPWAVVNDDRFLTTLSDRDWRAGLSEAIKVAALKDAAFFAELERLAPRLRERDAAAAEPVIRRCAELHLDHIADGGDPFELMNARPLDFGHWSAHKLEQVSDFRVKHGEAVAIGIALDVLYSLEMGLLKAEEAERVLGCLSQIGFALYDAALEDHETILDGLEEFREHLGGRLTITLLRGIGQPLEVHKIDRARMAVAMERLAAWAETHAPHAPADAPERSS
jgi:3-dehydroquinate synthase